MTIRLKHTHHDIRENGETRLGLTCYLTMQKGVSGFGHRSRRVGQNQARVIVAGRTHRNR
jgi:hypothetical protein